jgi:hypothetical protein
MTAKRSCKHSYVLDPNEKRLPALPAFIFQLFNFFIESKNNLTANTPKKGGKGEGEEITTHKIPPP